MWEKIKEYNFESSRSKSFLNMLIPDLSLLEIFAFLAINFFLKLVVFLNTYAKFTPTPFSRTSRFVRSSVKVPDSERRHVSTEIRNRPVFVTPFSLILYEEFRTQAILELLLSCFS